MNLNPVTMVTNILEHEFHERVSGLIKDRYALRFCNRTPTLWLARLHHMANGNDIVIKAYPQRNEVVQLTNKVEVYRHTFA